MQKHPADYRLPTLVTAAAATGFLLVLAAPLALSAPTTALPAQSTRHPSLPDFGALDRAGAWKLVRDPFRDQTTGRSAQAGATSEPREAIPFGPSLPKVPSLPILPANAGADGTLFGRASAGAAVQVAAIASGGQHPAAIVIEGAESQVVGVGDLVGNRRITAITPNGILLRDGSTLGFGR